MFGSLQLSGLCPSKTYIVDVDLDDVYFNFLPSINVAMRYLLVFHHFYAIRSVAYAALCINVRMGTLKALSVASTWNRMHVFSPLLRVRVGFVGYATEITKSDVLARGQDKIL